MAKKLWAGLDIGVETTSVCVVDEVGEVLHEAVCPTDVRSVHREIGFIRRRRSARVGLESGCGINIARGLRNLGYSVDIYESRQLSKFLSVRRNKSDASDANWIAHTGRVGAPLVSKVHLKSLECQALVSRLTMRRQLVSMRVRSVNLLCRQFEVFGGRIGSCRTIALLRTRVEAQIKTLFKKGSTPLVDELRLLLDRCEDLWRCQTRLDSQLNRLARENDLCRRLMEIPGVGPICALTFFATVAEPHRFRRSADIGPFLGMTPRLFQSGLSQRVGRISKLGSRPLRSLLVHASVSFMKYDRSNSRLQAWALEVEQRRGRGKARVALARKLATIMLAMWKSGLPYRPALIPAADAL